MSFRIHADIAHVRARIPETLASVTPVHADAETGDGWLRVFLRAERLEWVAGTLAMLDRHSSSSPHRRCTKRWPPSGTD